MGVFNYYANVYDALYKDKDYKTEANRIGDLLAKHNVKGNKICVFGCGTGEHDCYLREMGYSVHGIDMSEEMIKIAQNKGAGTYEVADIRQYNSREKYDAVLSLFHVMSYQNTNEDIKSAFRSAYHLLDKGGIFIFDSWYGPGVLRDLPTVRVKQAKTEKYDITRIAIPKMYANQNKVEVNYDFIIEDLQSHEIIRMNEIHPMRYFFKPEIEEYLKEEGFELVSHIDDKTMSEPDYSSWTSLFVAKAI